MQFGTKLTTQFLKEALNPSNYSHIEVNPKKDNDFEITKRFKTIEEFEKEYGSNFRNIVVPGFSNNMDILLGMPFIMDYSFRSEKNLISYKGYTISSSMLIDYTKEEKEVINQLYNIIKKRSSNDGVTIFNNRYSGDVFTITLNPTGNCQLQTIGYFMHIIGFCRSYTNKSVSDGVIWTILSLALGQMDYIKPLVHIDIREEYQTYVEGWPTVVNVPYTSSNRTQMVCIYLKIN